MARSSRIYRTTIRLGLYCVVWHHTLADTYGFDLEKRPNILRSASIKSLSLHTCFNLNSNMPFLADSHIPIPNKDILSWIFEDATANPHKPVRAKL